MDLRFHSARIVLEQKAGWQCSDDRISEDLRRLPPNQLVVLKWKSSIQRLIKVLGGCKMLAYLDLTARELGAEGAGMLAGVLVQCKALAYLDLSKNGIGAEGARVLAGVLEECKSLAHLNMSENTIGVQGVGLLARVVGD
eukprot:1989351-Rhodomonas_salina.1